MLASFARAGNGGLARWSSSMVSISLLSLYRRHSSCLIKHCKGSFSLAYAQLENILNPSWTCRYQFIPLKYFCKHGQVTIRQAMSKRLKVTGTISCCEVAKTWTISWEPRHLLHFLGGVSHSLWTERLNLNAIEK